jgi:hypothetical protein
VRARHITHAIVAFVVGSALAALLLVMILPVPPARVSNLSNFGQLMALSLLGPILFPWAWGPAPLGTPWLLAAVAIPGVSVAVLWVGFFRNHSYPALICSTSIWSGFGGFSAFVAVTGSI